MSDESRIDYVCTSCTKRKRRDGRPLPAIDRYLSRRIKYVAAEGRKQGRPLLILSGEYGLLAPEDEIPWYDHPLLPNEVSSLASRVADQLGHRRARSVVFYAAPRTKPGWEPYYEVIEEACAAAGVDLAIRRLDAAGKRQP